MLVYVSGKNQNVVEVNEYITIDHIPESVTDKCLEDNRNIRKTTRHDQVLEVPQGVLNAIFYSSPSLLWTRR